MQASLEKQITGVILAGGRGQRMGDRCLRLHPLDPEAGEGMLDGFVIWGDVAYKHGTFMSPAYWRKFFKPWVAAMVERDFPVLAGTRAGQIARFRLI